MSDILSTLQPNGNGASRPTHDLQTGLSDGTPECRSAPTAPPTRAAGDGAAPVDAAASMSATPTAAANTTAELDPFDPENLRLPSNFTSGTKVQLSVPVSKPDRSWWFRVHPSGDFRLQTQLLVVQQDKYLVASPLWSRLDKENLRQHTIFTGVNRQGIIFLWPIRMPRTDGYLDNWAKTEMEAADEAMRAWRRLIPNHSLGAHDVERPEGQLPDPDWPKTSFRDLLEKAFADHRIDNWDHPVLQQLRGAR